MRMKGNEIIKKEAIAKYGSLRKFGLAMQLPPGVITAILDTPLDDVSYSTVMRMCIKLKLNPTDLTPMTHNQLNNLTENKIMSYYKRLNATGRRRFVEIIDGMCQLPRYLNEKEEEDFEEYEYANDYDLLQDEEAT